jgi:y4mF family transcriptional regulator
MHIKITKNEIGQIIKKRRIYLGITQKDLAEIVGISLRSLVDIEKGNGNPTIDQLTKILNALGLTIKISVL